MFFYYMLKYKYKGVFYMEFIKLETLSLHIIDKQNKNDLEFVKKLVKMKV